VIRGDRQRIESHGKAKAGARCETISTWRRRSLRLTRDVRDGWRVLLDGKAMRTPAKNGTGPCPTRALARSHRHGMGRPGRARRSRHHAPDQARQLCIDGGYAADGADVRADIAQYRLQRSRVLSRSRARGAGAPAG